MKVFFFIFILTCFSFIGRTQPDYFNKKFDIKGDSDFGLALITTDSGYVVFGSAIHNSIPSQGYYLLFLDKNGDSLFTKWYGEINTLYSPCWAGGFRKYSKGGFYMGGGLEDSLGNDYGNLWLFSENGDTLWTKKYGNGLDFKTIYHARETPDKGFILAGSTSVGSNSQGLLIKTDSLGNVQWQQTYGGSGREYGTSVLPLNDGRFLLGGTTETAPCGTVLENQSWLLKANANGSQNWSKCYGYPTEPDGSCYPAFEFSNGDVAVVGAYAAPYALPYVMRVNTSGNIIGDDYIPYPILGYSGYLISAIQGSNEDILAVGGYMPSGTDYGLFVRYSANIDSIWYRTYSYGYSSGTHINEIWDIDTAHGGGYIMCGETSQSGIKDVWVIKVDNHGCLFDPDCWLPGAYEEDKWSVGISQIENENYFSVYPNPNNGNFTLVSNIGIHADYKIEIYNLVGKKLLSSSFQNARTELDISAFSAGLYFVAVTDGTKVLWRRKVIKE